MTKATDDLQVTEIWRYPVKSLQGEHVASTPVSLLGIEGDRAWGIRDEQTGKTLTGRREPQLLFAGARLVDGDVVITLPDGTETNDDAALSTWLSRDVALTPAATGTSGSYEIQLDFETEVGEWFEWQGPDGSFHDSTKTRVSIVSAATMRDWDQTRFRMNLITSDSNEEALIGSDVRIGGDGGPRLSVLKEVDRCIMVTRPQSGGIERDLDVLRTINSERGGNLGIGANVVEPGVIRVGDRIAVANATPPG